ncbi:aminoglycoside phosphotransferase family protein [Stenotrophobium rhamnosiphilum]|uniref:Aminoglycoside phosphotransferase n=1 Tax=Stenotrophobium rhamnosiphilum TaxID=2029166 RepID=A0A2T5MJH5_9GAMM|nr:phosphotransferase [Stenotrophobium rhamnosiphilum]PTU32736.1 aminoglycoside phosphotransferase [Stenotrophobium rhamnosiphilum]
MTIASFANDPRAQSAYDWASAQLGRQDLDIAPASADASFRRYFRLSAAGQSWVLMDAPPDKENCEPFIHIAGLVRDAKLNGPIVHAQDLKQGFLLLSDLGTQTYLHVINEANADELFAPAITALIHWQLSSKPDELPPYDEALLRRELSLFPDWYVAKHLQRSLTPAQAALLRDAEDVLVARALAQAKVYVHRDYMPRNLMISTPNPGILDFQDAVFGPITYDVASLFKDAFLSWPEQRVRVWVKQYWTEARAAGLPLSDDFESFFRDFELMGVQRHLKVLGIFARINYRDGKPHYLADTPRFIRYVREVAARHPELAGLVQLFDELELNS